VSVGVFYGRFQEMGTGARKGKTKSKKVREKRVAAGISASGVKGQRFLRGAVAEARPVLERAIARRVSG
jgi:hypothetical protein